MKNHQKYGCRGYNFFKKYIVSLNFCTKSHYIMYPQIFTCRIRKGGKSSPFAFEAKMTTAWVPLRPWCLRSIGGDADNVVELLYRVINIDLPNF